MQFMGWKTYLGCNNAKKSQRKVVIDQFAHTRQWRFYRIWDPTILQVFSDVPVSRCITLSKNNIVDLFDTTIRKLCPTFRGLQDDFFVVRVRANQSPLFSNRVLHARDAFIYNRISDRIEISTQRIPFPGSKINPNKTVRTLIAFRGLAQILAVKAEVGDIFIISGNGCSLAGDKLDLNGNCPSIDSGNDSRLDIIQFSFPQEEEEELQMLHMVEHIIPHKVQPDLFYIMYKTCKLDGRGKRIYAEKRIRRTFELYDNLDHVTPKPPFQAPIYGNPGQALRVYNAMTQNISTSHNSDLNRGNHKLGLKDFEIRVLIIRTSGLIVTLFIILLWLVLPNPILLE